MLFMGLTGGLFRVPEYFGMKFLGKTCFLIALVLSSFILVKPVVVQGAEACASNPIPGGGTITFTSNRNGNYQIFVMDGDECHLQLLTDDGNKNTNPAWSPDGTKLAYSVNGVLYVMSSDGSNRHPLVTSPAPAGNQHVPAWSPDGNKLVFNIDIGWQAIYSVNANGTGLTQLVSVAWHDNYSPSWSPDGTQILYTNRRLDTVGEAWLMNPDGSNKHVLIGNLPDAEFIWSPDGTKIAFQSRRDGVEWEIYVMNADGTNQTRLTYNTAVDANPVWSLDGTRLAFESNRDGNDEIYVMNVDGTNQTRVTSNGARDFGPVWGGPRMNQPPTVSGIVLSEALIPVNTGVNASAEFVDPDTSDTHTASWGWGDGTNSTGVVTETNGSGVVSGSHVYGAAGVYTVEVTVTDDDGGAGTATYQYVVVYDPEGGFVTGGGWINSPEGAYAADPLLSGVANFGMVAKYKKGAVVPTGNTEFQFKIADLNFHSSEYQWLVMAGPKAQFKGTGAINGEEGYGFMLTAIDGQLPGGGETDKLRMKIWNRETGEVVYDNQVGASDTDDPATEIGGGSIVIHK